MNNINNDSSSTSRYTYKRIKINLYETGTPCVPSHLSSPQFTLNPRICAFMSVVKFLKESGTFHLEAFMSIESEVKLSDWDTGRQLQSRWMAYFTAWTFVFVAQGDFNAFHVFYPNTATKTWPSLNPDFHMNSEVAACYFHFNQTWSPDTHTTLSYTCCVDLPLT